MPENEPNKDDKGPAEVATEGAGKAEAAVKEKPRPAPRRGPPKLLPPYNVVLLDDDEHSYEYVIEMLKSVFAYPEEKGFMLAREVDSAGRVIVLTTHKERAELKRDQILGYGPDPRDPRCKGSMRAVIEPAAEG